MFRSIFRLLQNDNLRKLYTITLAPLKHFKGNNLLKRFFAVKLTCYRLKDYKLYCDLRWGFCANFYPRSSFPCLWSFSTRLNTVLMVLSKHTWLIIATALDIPAAFNLLRSFLLVRVPPLLCWSPRSSYGSILYVKEEYSINFQLIILFPYGASQEQ